MKKSARIITIITILISLLGGTLIQSARAESKVIHVKWDAGGSNNGTSWTNAYTDLQLALSAAVDGDEIWVAAGTYKPTTNADRTVSFELKNGVAIYGGFFGNETLRTQHNPATNVTILSGDIGITDDYSDNSYHVVVGNDIDNSAILNGFTITLGNANNFLSNPGTAGGGMLNENSSPTLVNLIFSTNIAYGHGGGISNLDNSNPSLTNVIFQNNSAVSGGGMANISSNPTLMNVIFTNNSVTAYGEAYGGGMSNQSSNPILENISFISNTAKQGGGIMNYQSNPTINKVTFSGNSAISGGGMYNWLGSNPTITNSTFSGNSATQGGGGGIFNLSNSYSTIINTTMANNSAFHGGAIYNGNNGSSIIRNSILYANSGVQIYNNNVAANVTYSIVHGGYPGEGNIDADPLINSLQNNGGFTQTMALLPDSPAINAGDDANCPATDQRGVTRPQGSHCDIGAYEYEGPPPTFADVPLTHSAWQYIEAIYNAGITGGCTTSPLNYCPNNTVTRAQMAIFLLRGIHGSAYTPPAVGDSTGFNDVPTTHSAAAWIKQLAAEGITGGCGNDNYCPNSPVTRAQMAIFLLRAKYGDDHTPPAVGDTSGFNDVPTTHSAAAWIKQLAAEGITGGCGNDNYCPNSPVTRAQMAIFLQRTFNLPMP